MNRVDGCLDSDALLAWAAGKLTDAEREQALVHLDACSTCRQALSALARIEPTVQREPIRLPIAPAPRHRGTERTWAIIGLAAIGGVGLTLAIAMRFSSKPPHKSPAPNTVVATPIADPPKPSATTEAPLPPVASRPVRSVKPPPPTPPPPTPPPAQPEPEPEAAQPAVDPAVPGPASTWPAEPPAALADRKVLRLARIGQAMDGPGEWSLRPRTQVLIAATPRGQLDDRYDMGEWWLAVPPGTPGTELLAARRRVWVIAIFERFAEIDPAGRQAPAPVLRALEIHASPTSAP